MRTFLFTLFLSTSVFAQGPSSLYPISKVKVYRQGAQIHRAVNMDLKSGRNTLEFSGLSASLDPNSIQLKGLASLSLISISQQKLADDSIQNHPSLETLKKAIRENEAKQRRLNDEKQGLLLELKYLESNTNVGGTDGYNLTQLREVSQYVKQVRITNAQASTKIDLERQNLNGELQKLQKQLSHKINLLRQASTTIIAEVISPKAQKVKLSLSYQCHQAGWSSSYDLKVTSLDKPVELWQKAEIHQNTGEDWSEVAVELNTGSMMANGQIPTLHPNYLYPLPNERLRGARAEASPVRYSNSREASRDKAMADEPMASANNLMSSNLMSRSYILAEKLSLARGKKETNLLRRIELPAVYEYQSIPKIDPSAYLIAKIYDWAEYNLESGKVALYNDGNFVGKSYLSSSVSEDTLDLSLGKDADIVVQREKLIEESGNSFLGSKKTTKYTYELKVFNKKSNAINLVLIDQIPVAQHEDIKVEMKIGKLSVSQLTQGEIRWKLKVPAKAEISKKHSYQITYPKEMKLNL